ncbi:anti-sigma factor [Mycolicibacterium sp. 120270]|uniref:anti-sigma factor n=1 Tax=Mycolicibacterium sp. 120270 TaxID=3090600 RepID=UPI00299E4BA0|nr:anti-sigma factor [Mycolicibacterium sp. 120270]MDX1885176.1 anti-sigma factor [Mycolicibacterium sp. 120270]
MTEPMTPDIVTLATPYALHAMTEAERVDIERQLADAPPEVAEAFFTQVRAVHETMALISAATAIEPPPSMRTRLLATVADEATQVRPVPTKSVHRWRTTILAAAAVIAVGLGALGVGIALRPAPQVSTAEQIFAAPDVQTVSGAIPSGGTATLVYSHEKDAGVLMMNNVPPPKPGTVYQMWLVGDGSPKSAGTMDAAAVAPSTTAVLPDLGTSRTLAFTVEPGSGSEQPTTPIFAELPLT